MPLRSHLFHLGAAADVSSLLTLFVRNFISGEKKIKQRIPRRYAIAGGQFERSMSQLLGPVEVLLSGNIRTPGSCAGHRATAGGNC